MPKTLNDEESLPATRPRTIYSEDRGYLARGRPGPDCDVSLDLDLTVTCPTCPFLRPGLTVTVSRPGPDCDLSPDLDLTVTVSDLDLTVTCL
ncbi:hypothetical protein WMY93_022829 [Mugilogobius chulae]|uniref:Uncharacterized protein n=1 Tax=Mugilogobius chulae TaxID=88201 RepID=A0AAW0NCJ3_9GOBI